MDTVLTYTAKVRAFTSNKIYVALNKRAIHGKSGLGRDEGLVPYSTKLRKKQ
jgi:hypothetical protein